MQVLRSQHLLPNKKRGFTTVELMIASVIFLSLISVAFRFTTVSLKTQKVDSQTLELQQNLRVAMQLIVQDIRSSTGLHVLNHSNCQAAEACSNNEQISVVSAQGDTSVIKAVANRNYRNLTRTKYCQDINLDVGDTAMLLNIRNISTNEIGYNVLDITNVTPMPRPNRACTNANSFKINHNPVSGNWGNNPYISKADVATYFLATDPLDQSKKVLFRRSGISSPDKYTGIVAFGVSDLKISYGIKTNPGGAQASQLTFFDSLEDAASALGPNYSAEPILNKKYVGNEIEAIHIKLVGETREAVFADDGTNHPTRPATFTVEQTVELRR